MRVKSLFTRLLLCEALVGFAATLAALLLPMFFGLDGVLYSMPAADILTFAVTLIVIVLTYKKLK